MKTSSCLVAAAAVVLLAGSGVSGQQAPAGQAPAGAQPAIHQRLAAIDLTGTWVSVVTEDWEVRMITPPKGYFNGLTINDAARAIGNAWDPAQDQASGNACKAYGAAGVMRMPGRVRIGWQDGGNTLRVETDAGQQTRNFHFGGSAPPAGERSWQGQSVATWEYAGGFDPANPTGRAGRGGGGGAAAGGRGGRAGAPPGPPGGALKVVTANLRPGYLRKNGVPYSADTVVTEYYNVHTDPTSSTDWLVVTTIVHDPTYLLRDYITSSNFKREPDDSKWRPAPCTAQ